MQVTHTEARRFIQLRLDAALNSRQQDQLSAHLERCATCRVYAEKMKNIDQALAEVSQQHYRTRHLPLSIPMLMEKSSRKNYQGPFLTMRTTAMVLMFAMLAFSTWSFFSGSPPATPGAASLVAPPVPTPSGQSTSTKASLTDCEIVLYTVQQHDTLASLARRFSVTEAEIVSLNNLKDASIESKQLWLPVCNFTPTGTAQGSATLTKTHTPVVSPITSTPGG